MEERNQAGREENEPVAPSFPSPAPEPYETQFATVAPPDSEAPPGAAGPPAGPDPATARTRLGLLAWFFVLLVFGAAGIAVGQIETAGLVALGTILAAAHAADLDPFSRRTYLLVSWVIPSTSVALFVELAVLLFNVDRSLPVRAVAFASALVGLAVSVALLFPAVAGATARGLLHEDPPGLVAKLATRLTALGLLLAIPGWFLFDTNRDMLLEKPEALVDPSHLTGGLFGYVLLALGGVGWLVRRDTRQTLERLGLRRPVLRDLWVVALGVVILAALNTGADALQHRVFPKLWAADHEFTKALAGKLSAPFAVLLGISAGVGEEITLRGALQPRLGILFTSLLFAGLHVQYSWFGIGTILLLGLTLGTIRKRRGTTAAILVHALYDLLAVLGS